MLPGLADIINACLEFFAAAFISLSIRKLYHDKKVRGISWAHVAFFMGWGYWNLLYYPAVGSMLSFKAGILVTAANSVYLAMLLYYTWQEKAGPKLHNTKAESMFCETYLGKKFYVLHPDADVVDPIDIAHSLSNTCRYMGHTTCFYSVAEHCCLLADYCMEQGWGPERAFAALIHDAGEAYTGDAPRPWKAAVPILKELEQRIDDVVLPALGGSPVKPEWLEEIDARIIMDERQQIRTKSDNVWMTDKLEPLGVIVKGWKPVQAEKEWLYRYGTLSAEMGVPHGGTEDVADIYP